MVGFLKKESGGTYSISPEKLLGMHLNKEIKSRERKEQTNFTYMCASQTHADAISPVSKFLVVPFSYF